MVYLTKAVHNEMSVQSLCGGQPTREGNSQKGNGYLGGSNLQADSAEAIASPKAVLTIL